MPFAPDWLDDLAFRTRARLRWSAPAWQWPARSFKRLARHASAEAQARVADLRSRYPLEGWPRLLSRQQLQENLYVLDVLDRILETPEKPITRALDVGAKDGAMLPARVARLPGPWDLVELDAHRRYLDLSTRRAHGERFAAAFPECRYLATSALELADRYDAITWFLPFVRLGPLRTWGLPARCFQPDRLFAHVLSLLAPGGVLLIVNQGEIERDVQQALFTGAGIAVTAQPVESPLSPFRLPRFLFRWRRPLAP